MVGVEGSFDAAHDLDARAALGFQRVNFAQADAVLASASSPGLQCPLDDLLAQPLHLRQFRGIARLNEADDVEVAVADVAKKRRGKVEVGKRGSRLVDAASKGRDRYADIGYIADRAGAECPRGVIGIVARLPQAVALPLGRGPAEGTAAPPGHVCAGGFSLFDNPLFRAVKFKKERWCRLVIKARVLVASPHLYFVEQFEPCDGDPRAQDVNGRGNGGVEIGKGADGRGNGRWQLG